MLSRSTAAGATWSTGKSASLMNWVARTSRGFRSGLDASAGSKAATLVFCIFDVLVQSGHSVMELPYTERKSRLKRLFMPTPGHSLLVVGSIPETGKELSEPPQETRDRALL